MEVSFRKHDGDLEVCEIKYPDGRVTVVPASENDASLSRDRGEPVTYAQAFPGEYGAFKAREASKDQKAEQPQKPEDVEIKAGPARQDAAEHAEPEPAAARPKHSRALKKSSKEDDANWADDHPKRGDETEEHTG